MKPLSQFLNSKIEYLFSDIDDTLTTDGQLPADAYAMIWKLHEEGIQVVPVTGRPAGWCDMIARFWPVPAVIGENGAFYFAYDGKKMHRRFAYGTSERRKSRELLRQIRKDVLAHVPGAAVSADQFSRLFDLAIDFCEDVPALSAKDIDRIVAIFEQHGAQAKVSSIHVNGWFGDHNKLSMCEIYCQERLGFEVGKNQARVAFVGDSPNDEPMFRLFTNSFGVANVRDMKDRFEHLPAFVAKLRGGEGFVEIGEALLKSRRKRKS